MIFFTQISHYVLLAVGLGFVVFFHELGHFLAAKYCDVNVEQFAVGFGSAVVAWRKGIGFRRGTTRPEMEARVDEYFASRALSADAVDKFHSAAETTRAMTALNLGETEYRLNWIPLGGYVKMLGQDDMDATNQSDDPRAFNKKSVPRRMLIISAGVLMNILLAGIGFMIVFLIGFKAPPAEVGGVLSGSPASFAQRTDGSRQPLAVGDKIETFDGKTQHGFASVALTVALAKEGKPLPMLVRHVDGQEETLIVVPKRAEPEAHVLSIGVLPPAELRGFDVTEEIAKEFSDANLFDDDVRAIKPGDTITAIDGQPVPTPALTQGDKAIFPDDSWRLDQALSGSDSNAVSLTIRGADGSTRQAQIHRHFQGAFSPTDQFLGGMTPRARIDQIASKDSPAYGIVHPNDVILAVTNVASGVTTEHPSLNEVRDIVNDAGQAEKKITLTLLAPDHTTRTTAAIEPTQRVDDDRRGLNIRLGYDEQNTVVAAVDPGSAAQKAGILPGWQITKVAGQSADNWFAIRRIFAAAQPGEAIEVEAQTPKGPAKVQLTLSADEIDAMKYLTVTSNAWNMLHERTDLRKTNNPITAAVWGVAETRDFILQFYVTIQRMFGGSVSYKEAMGPVGIVRFGAASAARGPDWLIWFLAMISANLAVANFLPIPVMDGGLFVLLIVESIQGRPLSMKTQQVIQMVGLAIIVSIFVLVTYQDITRSMGHG